MINLQSLAALAVRLLGLALLVFTVPSLFSLAGAFVAPVTGAPSLSTAMGSLVWLLFLPVVGIVLMLFARPIGRLIARGIE